jgi:hypothetical protein
MRSSEAHQGRTIVVTFDHGDDFYTALHQACVDNRIRSGYVPMFIAGFATADLVGTCERLEDPQAPVWSKVQLSNIEALGGGTIAWDKAASFERIAAGLGNPHRDRPVAALPGTSPARRRRRSGSQHAPR